MLTHRFHKREDSNESKSYTRQFEQLFLNNFFTNGKARSTFGVKLREYERSLSIIYIRNFYSEPWILSHND